MAKEVQYSSVTFGMDGNDIAVSGGRFVISRGKSCYAIQIHTAIKTVLGEILLAPSVGIPYFDTVFNPSSENGLYIWESRVRDIIGSFPFVISIMSFDYELKDRKYLKYKIVIETDDGIITESSDNTGMDFPDDSDVPTMFQPLRGTTLAIDTDEELANSTNKVEIALDQDATKIETLEDQYVSTKKLVKSLGGDTIDEIGDVSYNNDRPPFKPLEDQTLKMENDEEVHEDVKTIIQILGGSVK